MKLAGSADRTRASTWLVNPWLDSLGIAWAWLPFYLFVVFGLGLDGDWSLGGRDGNGTEPGLGLATMIALGASYVHRHYTFVLVYGDRETFDRRLRAYTLIPALLFVGLALIVRLQGDMRVELFGLKLSPWFAVLIVTGGWNVWHTIMQRHGIARIYAGKAGGGLEQREHGRRDRRLLWSAVVLTAVLTLKFRGSTFAAIANARRTLKVGAPIVDGWLGWSLLFFSAAMFMVFARSWLSRERAAELGWGARVPRLNFLASTAALLMVLVVHGPVIGYLCFGFAHALEYIVFFHVFGQKKFARRATGAGARPPSVAARLLARPWLSGPVFALVLTGLFFALADHRKSEPFLVYYTATSLLHFLYDGWIWKVRKPEVAKPLGIGS